MNCFWLCFAIPGLLLGVALDTLKTTQGGWTGNTREYFIIRSGVASNATLLGVLKGQESLLHDVVLRQTSGLVLMSLREVLIW